MKVNIISYAADARPGYLNIMNHDRAEEDVVPPGAEVYGLDDVSNLSSLVSLGEADEIVAINVLEYLIHSEVDAALNNWCDVLSIGGKITIASIDVCEIAFALNEAKITETDANLLLHGHQREPWEHKHANYSIQTLSSALEGRGLRVVRKSLNGLWAIVTAERK